jgi:hypothetical protein
VPSELNSMDRGIDIQRRSKYQKRTDCQASRPEAGTDKNSSSQDQLEYAAKQDHQPSLRHTSAILAILSSVRWRSPKQRKFLFPVRAVAALFRGKFLAELRQMLAAEELHLPDSELKIPANRARWFSLLYRKRWVLYAKCPFGGPQQVVLPPKKRTRNSRFSLVHC